MKKFFLDNLRQVLTIIFVPIISVLLILSVINHNEENQFREDVVLGDSERSSSVRLKIGVLKIHGYKVTDIQVDTPEPGQVTIFSEKIY